ncbi:chorismate mutase [Sphingobium subterraneum]|uniref:chorismate mutase n=1 Tax=Sphingobium subterraneum TaxID=627688 RepID=A0A841IY05_9SPHN|nr:chorismate mutase [Sphingobium subterraneum]MBB6123190.1 isochorismate pyruvate lyase [Sphingobium subterraneum]
MSDTLPPEECQTMVDVRAGVDTLDRALVTLLARRFAYMRAAARIKPDRDTVRDEPRKHEVIDNVRREAERLGAPADVIAALWDSLVEASIAYELAEYDHIRQGEGSSS